MIHSVLASEAGAFTIADVARGVHTKLVRRHPHVFGDVEADTPDAVITNWEQIKKGEKGHTSLVEGITPGLPALIYVQKLLRKAASIGLVPDLAPGGTDANNDEDALGDALAALTVSGAEAGLDGESALAAWAGRFKARFTRHGAARDRRRYRSRAGGTGGRFRSLGPRRRPGPRSLVAPLQAAECCARAGLDRRRTCVRCHWERETVYIRNIGPRSFREHH